MDKKQKIKLKSKNSQNNILKKLDAIAKQDISSNRHKIRPASLILSFTICIIIGLWIGLGLSSHGVSDGMYVTYKQTNSKTASKSSNKSNKSNKSSKTSSSQKKSTSGSSKKTSSVSPKTKNVDSDNDEKSNQSSSDDEKHEYINNTVGNSVSNSLNGGFLAEEDEWIYYIDSKDSNNLCRINYKTFDTDIVLNVPVSGVNILKNTIYAKQTDMLQLMLQFLIDDEIFSTLSIGCDYISVLPDCIITSDNNCIYKIVEDKGIEKEVLYTGEITSSTAYDDTIYFIQYNALYQINIKDNSKQLVKENVDAFTVGEFGLYYIYDNKLYLNGIDEPLFNISLSCLNINDNILYFNNLDDDGKLYSIDLNGSDLQKISDLKAEKICVTEHQIAIKSDGNIILI